MKLSQHALIHIRENDTICSNKAFNHRSTNACSTYFHVVKAVDDNSVYTEQQKRAHCQQQHSSLAITLPFKTTLPFKRSIGNNFSRKASFHFYFPLLVAISQEKNIEKKKKLKSWCKKKTDFLKCLLHTKVFL